jgi:hypothetical protein
MCEVTKPWDFRTGPSIDDIGSSTNQKEQPMAHIRDLVLEIARDSSSPRTYRATVTYDVAFEPSERRDHARFRDTFLLRDADDGSDHDDLIGSVRGSFTADRAVAHRQLTISGLTDDTIRRRSGEDDIEAMATVQLRNLEVSDSLVVESARTAAFNVSLGA